MKKNYFYTTLKDEFSLLCRAVRSRNVSELSECERICVSRHNTFVSRLFREFITPVNREDLYEISAAVSDLFPLLAAVSGFPSPERERLIAAAELLEADPLYFDEEILQRYTAFRRIWEAKPCSSSVQLCFQGFDRIFRAMTVASLRNV